MLYSPRSRGDPMNRGEIWWLERPGAGRRPVCVLTRQTAIPVLNRVIVVPATRTIRGIPSEVELTGADGMPDRCVLSLDNLRVVPKALLTSRITRLKPAKLTELRSALAIATGYE